MDKKPTNDTELKTALDKLFNDWRKAVSFGDSFVEDGALPGYFDQKFKILFIGWEAHGCVNDQLMREILEPILLGDKSTWDAGYLALRVAYGISSCIESGHTKRWEDIPESPKGISFAFMNASKFAAHLNDNGSKPSENFENYARESLDFTRKEIDLLNPDLIISWNLGWFLASLCGESQYEELKDKDSKDVNIWKYTSARGEIPVLNTWHFAADQRGAKEAKTDIYDPIMKAVEALVEAGILKPKQG